MGFQTPMHTLAKYLERTTSGTIQLPDFQRGYKWDEERVRQILITVLRGHPMGVVMLLETSNDQVRFKPRPIEGAGLPDGVEPKYLLLDGQQRLTSLTQALTGDGVVHTKDTRGKLLDRRFFVDIKKAVEFPEEIEEAVIAVPADGKVKANFDRDVVLDLSTVEKQHENGFVPITLLLDTNGWIPWMMGYPDKEVSLKFHETYVQPASQYQIPAIELDSETDKAAVATVFEKVNIGGLSLNVFELLTAVFAGDAEHYRETGEDFRLNDDWQATKALWSEYPVLAKVENTDFLQAVTMLASLKKQREHVGSRKIAVTAKREDVLRLTLEEYLEWRDPLRKAFIWASEFLADRHVFAACDIPYQKQLVPLAAIKVVLGHDADLHNVKKRIGRWYWSGVFGEFYGSANETRFARDLEMVPAWSLDEDAPTPRTVVDASFVESRLHSMRTRNSAAYKGVMALIMANNSKDWMEDKTFGAAQYKDMAVDIHHIFPQAWCNKNGIDDEHRESIVNKTMLSARTNRVIGGVAPSSYLGKIEKATQISTDELDALLEPHLVEPELLRNDEFARFFDDRREKLCQLVETAIGKPVPRDVSTGAAEEDSAHFEESEM